MPLVPEFHLSMSDLWNITARVAVLFPANLWCNSRERSPFVALDFRDFEHGVVSVSAPWDLPHLLELSPKIGPQTYSNVLQFPYDSRIEEQGCRACKSLSWQI